MEQTNRGRIEEGRRLLQPSHRPGPNYAVAYSGLADTYALLGDWQFAGMPTNEAVTKSKATALKALEVDDTLGEAHNSLAFCLDGCDSNFVAADREFRRAIELNPGYAHAHHWYSWHLTLLGRNNEAIAEMRKAESLDRLSLVINANLAELLLIAHFPDESIEQSRKTIDMDPAFPPAHNQLAQGYLAKQKYAEAIAELKKAIQLSGDSPGLYLTHSRNLQRKSCCHRAATEHHVN